MHIFKLHKDLDLVTPIFLIKKKLFNIYLNLK